MTMGSLFAGIGGFDLGFTRAGFTVSWQVEIDEWCRGILARHFPNAERHGDIRGVGAHNLKSVDVICGGFPCQPFSSAGKRGGTEDDRYLWPEMLRVIREVQPAWVVAENVNGLTVGEMVPVFEQVLSDLEGAGYGVQPFVIPACAVDAPHRRDRVWIVAHAHRDGKHDVPLNAEMGGTPKTVGHAASTGPLPASLAGVHRREESAGARYAKPQRRGGNVANSSRIGGDGARQAGAPKFEAKDGRCGGKCRDVSHANGQRCEERNLPAFTGGQGFHSGDDGCIRNTWQPEPRVGRLADGVPDRVAKLRALGNAVVPQIPELIARMILETERIEALRRAAA